MLREIVEGTIQRTLDMEAFRREVDIQQQEQTELNRHRRRVRELHREREFGQRVERARLGREHAVDREPRVRADEARIPGRQGSRVDKFLDLQLQLWMAEAEKGLRKKEETERGEEGTKET